MAEEDRRKFLKVATCAIGGGVGLMVGAPVLSMLSDPTSPRAVTAPTGPFDLGLTEQFRVGAEPSRVEIVAPIVRDAWTFARNAVLGAAWIRRTAPDKIVALSALCPHLGCAIDWDTSAGNFLCPCHNGRFSVAGDKLTGPSERGMDELPVTLVDGRLQLTWVRYKTGQTAREPA